MSIGPRRVKRKGELNCVVLSLPERKKANYGYAYRNGYMIALRGRGVKDCPFAFPDPLYNDWIHGWQDGDDMMRKIRSLK